MDKKSITLSSTGLQNIALNKYSEEDDFTMIFGQQKFRMKSFFAEFISPIVSRHIQSDPTIKFLNFGEIYSKNPAHFVEFTNNIITPDIFSLFLRISSGSSIEIDIDQAFKIRFLSIILGNEELFRLINENFTPEFNENNVSTYLKFIQSCFYFSEFSADFDFSGLVDYISKYFYLIDQNEFLKLPIKIQYSIISNPHLQIKSEDSLFDLIYEIITQNEKTNDSDEISSFLEQIEFTNLSENKLRQFLAIFDINQMTNSLWRKLFECFFKKFDQKSNRLFESTHSIIHNSIEYIENETGRFEGIINGLTKKCGGNVAEKGVVKVTASSVYKTFVPSNIVDFVDLQNFSSLNMTNQWIMLDFIDKKIRPNCYSIRTHKGDIGRSHLRNWVIEVSNTNNEDDWKIIDSRNDETSLDYCFAENTFKIDVNRLSENEFYRYIRLRQTGPNTRNCYSLVLSGLELFGSMISS